MSDAVHYLRDEVEEVKNRLRELEQNYQRLLRSIRDGQLMTVKEIEKQIKK